MTETIFTCRRCEMNLEVGHLEQPVTECPVCGWGRPYPALSETEIAALCGGQNARRRLRGKS